MMLLPQVQVLEKRLNDQFVMRRALEKALGYKPCSILSSNESCIPKVKLLFQCSDSGMREKENKRKYLHLMKLIFELHCASLSEDRVFKVS